MSVIMHCGASGAWMMMMMMMMNQYFNNHMKQCSNDSWLLDVGSSTPAWKIRRGIALDQWCYLGECRHPDKGKRKLQPLRTHSLSSILPE